MANQNPIPDFVDVATFLNLTGNKWWQFNDMSSGQKARIECAQPAPDKIHVKVSVGTKHSEHSLDIRKVEVSGVQTLEYKLLQSKMEGQTFTWVNGLIIPASWKVGDSISVVSKEGNPATGNPVRMTLKLNRSGNFKPPAGTPFPSNTELWGIELEQKIQDTGLGTELGKGTAFFAIGVGVVSVQGQAFGVFSILQLENWSGAH